MDNIRAVELEAEVWHVKTMADGSVNLVLRLPEYCMQQAGQLRLTQVNKIRRFKHVTSTN